MNSNTKFLALGSVLISIPVVWNADPFSGCTMVTVLFITLAVLARGIRRGP